MALTSLLENLDAAREVLSHAPAGLFVDIDGTLADIAPTPDDVDVPMAVRDDLERITQRAPVSVLTGREVGDARGIVGSDALLYAGSHGTQWWQGGHTWVSPEAEPYVGHVHALAIEASRAFSRDDGYVIQDKGTSMSIHYRMAPDTAAARIAVFRFLAESPDARDLSIFQGKMVAEIRPPVALTKGTALRTIVHGQSLAGAIAIGDDTTDIDMFRAVSELRRAGTAGISVAVLAPEVPVELLDAADYALAGTRGVRRFLGWMAETLG